MAKINNYILVCGGTGCRASRSEEIIAALRRALDRTGESERTRVIRTGCFGFCEQGPIVKMIPDNTFYVSVKPEDAEEIVREHVVKGRKVERLLYTAPDTGQHVPDSKHMKFYKPQLRIALRNCGFIDPENIGEYIARDGYAALAKVLGMQPDHVLQEIIDSGLRGRGGGGFPTGLKWKITRDAKADRKYVVCNADEGDPGAFMDRSILEGDPHSILEAMAINGYCTGASHGLIYIRAEYPLAIERLRRAIEQAREYGLLGNDILGSGFSFDIELRYGAGAFVCGEETALIHSMEGRRGEPTVKPPYPSESGYKGYPTNVNNVETYACVGAIVRKGAEWFRSLGTAGSPGTKVFALAGKVAKVGLVELVEIDYVHRRAEFQIIIAPAHQGLGYAAKAVLLVMDYAFTVLNLYKLYLVVDTENKKAIHVYKKLGFEVEGELKHEFFSNGEYRNALRMCTFQTDYLMKKKEQAAQWA